MDLCEFEVSLIYIVSSRPRMPIEEDPDSKRRRRRNLVVVAQPIPPGGMLDKLATNVALVNTESHCA